MDNFSVDTQMIRIVFFGSKDPFYSWDDLQLKDPTIMNSCHQDVNQKAHHEPLVLNELLWHIRHSRALLNFF